MQGTQRSASAGLVCVVFLRRIQGLRDHHCTSA
jgi:hypothetical protein